MSIVPLAAGPREPPVVAAAPADLLALALSAIAASAPTVAETLPDPLHAATLAAAAAALRAQPAEADRALVALADTLDLHLVELLALAVTIGVETDPALCRALAAIQEPVGRSRPLLGLLAVAFAPIQPQAVTLLTLAEGVAVRCGLLRLDATDLPLPERGLAVHLPTLAALTGQPGDWQGVRLLPRDAVLPLPPALLDEAARWAAALAARDGAGLVLRTADVQEARAAAQAVAAALGQRAAWLEGESGAGLAAWLLAANALPVFACRLKPGEQRTLPTLVPYQGPYLVAAGADGAVSGESGPPGEWILPVPDSAARTALWQAGGVGPDAATRAGKLFRQGAGRIGSLAAGAGLAAGRRGAAAPDWDDLQMALAAQGAAGLDALARREPAPAGGVLLVAPGPLLASLDHLLDRCRLRETLADGLGPAASARRTPGVRALFHGPSGTGKSLAAHWLAARLGMPLHRADLAALTSKWIGETEKNLAELLEAAEHADVVLLFDEADALFASRTDVGDAHDRFANAQTNYLLQRMETFAGIAVLTSNGRDRFDSAFTRRLDAILEFPLPDAPARRDLWAAHLGSGAHDLDDTDIDRLAVQLDLAGGHIRNIVLAAAVRGQAAERPIGWDDLMHGAAAEYGKLGRPMPPDRHRGTPPGWA